MKKLLLILGVMGSIVSPCLAQQAEAPATPPAASQTVETKKVSGEVKAVTLADPAKGTKSEIVIVDKSGTEPKEYTFLVKSTTTIYDADWKATTFDKIATAAKVRVKYITTKEGVNEATAIAVKK